MAKLLSGALIRLSDALWKSLDVIMAILMALMIVLVFTNVCLRYGFSSGFRPSIELSRLGFVWIVMLGSVVVLRRGEHLAVSELVEVLFPRAVRIFARFSWFVILVSVSLLFWGASKQTIANWSNMSQLTGLTKGLLYLPGAISGFLMMFVAVGRLISPESFVVEDS